MKGLLFRLSFLWSVVNTLLREDTTDENAIVAILEGYRDNNKSRIAYELLLYLEFYTFYPVHKQEYKDGRVVISLSKE